MQLSDLNIEVSMVSPGFVVGLAAVALTRLVTPSRAHLPIAGLLCTLLIGLGSWPTLAALVGVAVFVLTPGSALIKRYREGSPRTARLILGLGIAVILGSWFVLKLHKAYDLPWLTGTALGSELLRLVGFSYFIFRAINVLYMHYLLGEVPKSGPLPMLLYTVFPPTLTSGPIQKYPDFCREAQAMRPLTFSLVAESAERLTRGYFYKVCLAPLFQAGADSLLAQGHFHVLSSLATMALLYVFVFFDFAGYSHIAVGFSLLLGIRAPENFRQPFLSTSVTEFWRNWHITIGDWFRDHVFIPLGGMRLGGWHAATFAAGIMLACGAWHGFTSMFLAWGVWHASILFFDGVLGVKPMPPAERHGPKFLVRVVWTNFRIAFGAIFFLPDWNTAGPVLFGLLKLY